MNGMSYRVVGLVAGPAFMVAAAAGQVTGPSTLQDPYMVPSDPASGVQFVSIASNGNGTNTPDEMYFNLNTGLKTYRMVGIPDGLGVFQTPEDLKNGTFTITSNHELTSDVGIVRDHGNIGAFVSQWTVRADAGNLEVIGGRDLSTAVYLWNPNSDSFDLYNKDYPMPIGFGRFCSADVAAPSAYRFGDLGTDARIHMDGEEIGTEGRAIAHIATGDEAGTSWELAWLGKSSWENSVASPHAQAKTVVLGLDDSTPGNLYFYVGEKQAKGSTIERAGLTDGTLYTVKMEDTNVENGQHVESREFILGNAETGPVEQKAFTMINFGDVSAKAGASLQADGDAEGQMNFLRPEDGAWNPTNDNEAYFVTTDSFAGNSRLWTVALNDIEHPEDGGVVTLLADGSVPASLEGGLVSATGLTDIRMMDNISVSRFGQVVICEDVGNNPRLGHLWFYDRTHDRATEIGTSDAAMFLAGGENYLTQDEETSGVIDAWDVLGPGWWLLDMQAHYSIGGELVEGGQYMAVYIPQTAKADCYADFDGDGAFTLFDFLGYVNSFNAGQHIADCTGDGGLDLFDFLCYTNAFNAGCP